jgi:hypothetical protein
MEPRSMRVGGMEITWHPALGDLKLDNIAVKPYQDHLSFSWDVIPLGRFLSELGITTEDCRKALEA